VSVACPRLRLGVHPDRPQAPHPALRLAHASTQECQACLRVPSLPSASAFPGRCWRICHPSMRLPSRHDGVLHDLREQPSEGTARPLRRKTHRQCQWELPREFPVQDGCTHSPAALLLSAAAAILATRAQHPLAWEQGVGSCLPCDPTTIPRLRALPPRVMKTKTKMKMVDSKLQCPRPDVEQCASRVSSPCPCRLDSKAPTVPPHRQDPEVAPALLCCCCRLRSTLESARKPPVVP